jgi:hypothetical protein
MSSVDSEINDNVDASQDSLIQLIHASSQCDYQSPSQKKSSAVCIVNPKRTYMADMLSEIDQLKKETLTLKRKLESRDNELTSMSVTLAAVGCRVTMNEQEVSRLNRVLIAAKKDNKNQEELNLQLKRKMTALEKTVTFLRTTKPTACS